MKSGINWHLSGFFRQEPRTPDCIYNLYCDILIYNRFQYNDSQPPFQHNDSHSSEMRQRNRLAEWGGL